MFPGGYVGYVVKRGLTCRNTASYALALRWQCWQTQSDLRVRKGPWWRSANECGPAGTHHTRGADSGTMEVLFIGAGHPVFANGVPTFAQSARTAR